MAVTNRLPKRELSGEHLDRIPPGLWPARSSLEGRYVRLEPIDPRKHAEELWAASHTGRDDDRIWDYLAYGPFPDPESFESWLRDCAAVADPTFYAACDGRTAACAGMASFLNTRPKHGVIEIGHIWFGLQLQNTRASTEALYLMMRNAFDDLGYRRLEWKCDARNQPSRDAAIRLGFAYEGTFYRHLIVKGCNRDTAWFSILESEWPALRANFESWLSPDNFEADGRQLRSLGELNRELRGAPRE